MENTTIIKALSRVMRGEASPVLRLAVRNLQVALANHYAVPDVALARAYVLEAWAEEEVAA